MARTHGAGGGNRSVDVEGGGEGGRQRSYRVRCDSVYGCFVFANEVAREDGSSYGKFAALLLPLRTEKFNFTASNRRGLGI